MNQPRLAWLWRAASASAEDKIVANYSEGSHCKSTLTPDESRGDAVTANARPRQRIRRLPPRSEITEIKKKEKEKGAIHTTDG